MSLIETEGQETKKLEKPLSEILEAATKHHTRYVSMQENRSYDNVKT